jgi:hypothetical protein
MMAHAHTRTTLNHFAADGTWTPVPFFKERFAPRQLVREVCGAKDLAASAGDLRDVASCCRSCWRRWRCSTRAARCVSSRVQTLIDTRAGALQRPCCTPSRSAAWGRSWTGTGRCSIRPYRCRWVLGSIIICVPCCSLLLCCLALCTRASSTHALPLQQEAVNHLACALLLCCTRAKSTTHTPLSCTQPPGQIPGPRQAAGPDGEGAEGHSARPPRRRRRRAQGGRAPRGGDGRDGPLLPLHSAGECSRCATAHALRVCSIPGVLCVMLVS